MEAALVAGLSNWGPLGLFCLWLMWRDIKRDARDEKRDAQRLEADKALAAANSDIATALVSLKTFVEAKL